MRLSFYRFPGTASPEIVEQYCERSEDTTCCSVSWAKQMLKQYGGSAWTEHIDRDGGCFEVTEIKLKGNNSRFKYNHHL